MIRIAPTALRTLVTACETAYPEEACGLLTGHAAAGAWFVRAAHPSANLAAAPRIAFEVDPALRLALHKAGRATGEEVIGHYHSHVDTRAQPSPRDLERAWEPDLIWLITSVLDGQAVLTTAHRVIDDGRRFAQLPLITDDWGADPARAPGQHITNHTTN